MRRRQRALQRSTGWCNSDAGRRVKLMDFREFKRARVCLCGCVRVSLRPCYFIHYAWVAAGSDSPASQKSPRGRPLEVGGSCCHVNCTEQDEPHSEPLPIAAARVQSQLLFIYFSEQPEKFFLCVSFSLTLISYEPGKTLKLLTPTRLLDCFNHRWPTF